MLLDALDTGGIWSVARGLARNVDKYKGHLAECDLQRRNDLDGRGNLSEESLAELHIKVMEHAHTLYLDVIEKLFKDEICPNVPQDTIAKGKTYYTKDWRLKNKIALVQNFKQFKKTVTGEIYKRELQKIKTV